MLVYQIPNELWEYIDAAIEIDLKQYEVAGQKGNQANMETIKHQWEILQKVISTTVPAHIRFAVEDALVIRMDRIAGIAR